MYPNGRFRVVIRYYWQLAIWEKTLASFRSNTLDGDSGSRGNNWLLVGWLANGIACWRDFYLDGSNWAVEISNADIVCFKYQG